AGVAAGDPGRARAARPHARAVRAARVAVVAHRARRAADAEAARRPGRARRDDDEPGAAPARAGRAARPVRAPAARAAAAAVGHAAPESRRKVEIVQAWKLTLAVVVALAATAAPARAQDAPSMDLALGAATTDWQGTHFTVAATCNAPDAGQTACVAHVVLSA